MNLEFVKDYRDQEELRRSFSELARETFGIDFEKWHGEGGWNGNYIPYSFVHEGRVVANASVNTMEMMVLGKIHQVIQIGTVMTRPDYRRKGLARNLLLRIFEDFDEDHGFYFLAADEEAVSLYESVGFLPVRTRRFVADVSSYQRREDEPARRMLPLAELLKVKSTSRPLSRKLSAVHDGHILAFYYTHGFRDCIYEPEKEVLSIFEKKDGRLHLYDVLSREEVDLQGLLMRIVTEDVHEVVFHFTPDQEIRGLSILDDEGGWMVRSDGTISLPDEFTFPSISQA